MNERRAGPEVIASMVGFLAAIALGLSAGALLAEAGVLVPWWRSLPPQSFLSWYAANASLLFDFYSRVEIASTVLALVAAALYRYHRGGAGGFFIASAALTLTILACFPVYFQPVNASFAAATIEVDQVATELGRWATWHWVRTAIGVGAFALAVLGVRAGAKGG